MTVPIRLRTPICQFRLLFLLKLKLERNLNFPMLRKRRIPLHRLINTQHSRKDKPRLGPPTLNKAQQRRSQDLRIHRPHLHTQPLGPKIRNREPNIINLLPLRKRRPLRAVLGKVHADNANAAPG